MNINIEIVSDCDCVYLVNGNFLEESRFCVADDEVTFLTVLPLDARFFSYTVKLIGCMVSSNADLALSVKTGEREYLLKLGSRLYVYSAGHAVMPEDPCCKFFYLVKGGHFEFASEMLTPELKRGLNDGAITRFFSDYGDIVKSRFDYYLVTKNGMGHKCVFSLSGGKIDNISVE